MSPRTRTSYGEGQKPEVVASTVILSPGRTTDSSPGAFAVALHDIAPRPLAQNLAEAGESLQPHANVLTGLQARSVEDLTRGPDLPRPNHRATKVGTKSQGTNLTSPVPASPTQMWRQHPRLGQAPRGWGRRGGGHASWDAQGAPFIKPPLQSALCMHTKGLWPHVRNISSRTALFGPCRMRMPPTRPSPPLYTEMLWGGAHTQQGKKRRLGPSQPWQPWLRRMATKLSSVSEDFVGTLIRIRASCLLEGLAHLARQLSWKAASNSHLQDASSRTWPASKSAPL